MNVKLTFRKVREPDLKRLNGIVCDEKVCFFLHMIPPVSLKSTRDVYARYRRDKNPWWCILVDGKLAGSMNLITKKKNTKQSHVASFGIAIASEQWGKDVGDKAIEFMLKEARKLKLKRIELEVVANNKRARKLYEKHDFVKEGVKKKSFKISGKYCDTIMMARWLD